MLQDTTVDGMYYLPPDCPCCCNPLTALKAASPASGGEILGWDCPSCGNIWRVDQISDWIYRNEKPYRGPLCG